MLTAALEHSIAHSVPPLQMSLLLVASCLHIDSGLPWKLDITRRSSGVFLRCVLSPNNCNYLHGYSEHCILCFLLGACSLLWFIVWWLWGQEAGHHHWGCMFPSPPTLSASMVSLFATSMMSPGWFARKSPFDGILYSFESFFVVFNELERRSNVLLVPLLFQVRIQEKPAFNDWIELSRTNNNQMINKQSNAKQQNNSKTQKNLIIY